MSSLILQTNQGLMKNKNNKNQEAEVEAIDGISAIRDILMGEQIAEFRAAFDDHKKAMGASEDGLSSALKDLEQKMDKRIDALEKTINQKFAKLEKLLSDNVENLNNRIDAVSDADKKNLASMLASLSQNLAKGDL